MMCVKAQNSLLLVQTATFLPCIIDQNDMEAVQSTHISLKCLSSVSTASKGFNSYCQLMRVV